MQAGVWACRTIPCLTCSNALSTALACMARSTQGSEISHAVIVATLDMVYVRRRRATRDTSLVSHLAAISIPAQHARAYDLPVRR
jgi:hypothetical protein